MTDKLTKQQEKILAQSLIRYYQLSEDSFLYFVRGLRIQVGGQTDLFEMVMADFQKETFFNIAPSLQALRDGNKPPTQRFWIERTKKASKDADLGAMVLWLCAFPKKPFFGQLAAVDSSQASIIKERISHLLHYNPWLNERVELIQNKIRSKQTKEDGRSHLAVVEIEATEEAGAHGAVPDLLIINELSHITNWGFVETMLTNADGVPDGLVIIATNAGYIGTKAHKMREMVLKSKHWSTHIHDRPAPWHDPNLIKGTLPDSAYRRLWLGEWISGKGDAIREEKISECFTLKKPQPPKPNFRYIAGLDLGISHDHSAIVVLGVDETNRKIETAYWEKWKPDGKEVDLQKVQMTALTLNQQYGLLGLFYDPTEARLMAQQLAPHIPMIEMSFSKPSNLDKMATSFLQAIEDNILQCYDDKDHTLRRDFGKFTLTQKTYGYRLEATRDERGHADVGTALVIAIPAAVEMLQGTNFNQLRPDDELVYDGANLTAEDLKTMPEDLKDIMESEDQWAEENGFNSKDWEW